MDATKQFAPSDDVTLATRSEIDEQFDRLGEAVASETGHDLALDFDLPDPAVPAAQGFGILRPRSGAFSARHVAARDDSGAADLIPPAATLERVPCLPAFPEELPGAAAAPQAEASTAPPTPSLPPIGAPTDESTHHLPRDLYSPISSAPPNGVSGSARFTAARHGAASDGKRDRSLINARDLDSAANHIVHESPADGLWSGPASVHLVDHLASDLRRRARSTGSLVVPSPMARMGITGSYVTEGLRAPSQNTRPALVAQVIRGGATASVEVVGPTNLTPYLVLIAAGIAIWLWLGGSM